MAEDLGNVRIPVPTACIAERILPVALRNWFFLASDCEEVGLGFNPCRAAETFQNCGNLLPPVVGIARPCDPNHNSW